jgi:hypothetical protein
MSEFPSRAKVQRTLVEELDGKPKGLHPVTLERRVSTKLGQPLKEPIGSDIESLSEMGVLEEVPPDNWRVRNTELATLFLATQS